MLVETWVAVLLIILNAVLILIPSLLSFWTSIRLDREHEENKALREANKELHKENTRLKSKLSLARLYVNMEDNK